MGGGASTERTKRFARIDDERNKKLCADHNEHALIAYRGVLAPLGPVFAPAEPSPRVVTPSVALARAHLGYDLAVRGMEAARVMAEQPSSNLAAGCICQLHFVKRSACRACAEICFHLTSSSKPRSTISNRSPSRSCIGKACRSGELRCCTSLARTCGTHGLLPIGR